MRDDWREVDLAHELIHGKIMFIDKYGIIICDNTICKLIRAYMEDIIVHDNIFQNFSIIPFDELFVSLIKKLANGLFKGFKIVDSYWDPKGLVCNQLHKAFLYVQVWHFNQLINIDEFKDFLTAFKRFYVERKEMELAEKIIKIIERNKNFNNKENYDHVLEEIIEIDYLDLLKEKLIKHYEKRNVGYTLI